MKRKQRIAEREYKVPRNFKLEPRLNDILKKEAAKTQRTQTAIVEMALRKLFRLEAA